MMCAPPIQYAKTIDGVCTYEGSAVHEALATPDALVELVWRFVRAGIGARKGSA